MPLAHFTLATRDVERTCAFFEQTLELRRMTLPDNMKIKGAWLEISPDQSMHILEVPDFEPSCCEREYGRHIALAFPRLRFAEMKRRLVEHGAELVAPTRPTPFERFFFRDPNGYMFEIVEEERYRMESDATR